MTQMLALLRKFIWTDAIESEKIPIFTQLDVIQIKYSLVLIFILSSPVSSHSIFPFNLWALFSIIIFFPRLSLILT